jgi:hypothetical protein
MTDKIIFVCDSRDYHAIDWFHIVNDICYDKGYSVMIATDIFDENEKFNLINKSDSVIQLYNINKLLIKKQSRFSDIWRNIIKLVTTPLQIFGLIKLRKQFPNAVFHAHSMYYIFLCWLARLKFIATPMGSDVLVRPSESNIYRLMTIYSLKAATQITVDSVEMQQMIMELSNKNSSIIQNGIDTRMITSFISETKLRNEVVSIRGFYPNYQIEELLNSREICEINIGITFIYPFYESSYRDSILARFIPEDKDLGRLTKVELYKLLTSSFLVISIPESDSSPRSVYESIFAGCCVAVTYSEWIDYLPSCMRSRLILVDLSDHLWLSKAITTAKQISKIKYIASKEALIEYDQFESMKKVCKEVYKIIT